MKKSFIWIVAAVLLAGVAVAAFVLTSDKSKPCKTEDLPVICYLDLHQLAEKGAFEEFITHDNRSLIASLASSQVDDSNQAKHLKDIITNLDAIGVNTKEPICCYLNDSFTNAIFVAKVSDATKLDSTVSLVSYILGDYDQEAIKVTSKGKTRSIDCEDFAVAYNNSLIALACGERGTCIDAANNAVNRSKIDLSVFGSSDFAVLVNIDKCLQIVNEQMNQSLALLQQEYNEGYMDEEEYIAQVEAVTEYNALLEPYVQYIGENASVMFSTTFDKGRLTFAYNLTGVNYDDEMKVVKRINTDHLANVSQDAYAVTSYGIDGEKFANYVRDFMTDEVLNNLGTFPTAEIKMGMSIACDALETIDGSITLALDNVDGEMTEKYDAYWDEYEVEPSIDSVDAILMADVNDTYIIGNIGQFAGDYLDKIDATHYSMEMMGYHFTMGQDDDLFHIGVNMTPAKKSPSALDAEWYNDIKKSYGFIVINVDAIMDGKFMTGVNKWLEEDMNKEERKLYRQVTDMLSYIYISADSYESAEFVVVFDDQDTNALKQITTIVMPSLVDMFVSSIY